eukprot:1746812-Pyramimonas_sp.AAC.1
MCVSCALGHGGPSSMIKLKHHNIANGGRTRRANGQEQSTRIPLEPHRPRGCTNLALHPQWARACAAGPIGGGVARW